jgi:hypothetical protein
MTELPGQSFHYIVFHDKVQTTVFTGQSFHDKVPMTELPGQSFHDIVFHDRVPATVFTGQIFPGQSSNDRVARTEFP